MRCENPRCRKPIAAGRRAHARHCDAVCRSAARRAKIRAAVADFAAYIAEHGTPEEKEAFAAMTSTAALAEAMGRALLAGQEAGQRVRAGRVVDDLEAV